MDPAHAVRPNEIKLLSASRGEKPDSEKAILFHDQGNRGKKIS
ncbi:hypothetical protein PSYPI_10878 [Pseudomonas syringae pv. pisi str. 1704B]|uniref:Uncharacterized protein n=1 Tax=Pseudomonas syringae pv. pisi str. 1704B TaxID=629263 RepID=F3G725_PSESJ|nr:hypothetical protein PSYPI_10878 [Pseudomonas syringae pv. pisi str. 1704B]